MKKLLAALLLTCPLAAVAQTQQDYEKAMSLFMTHYNSGDTDKICQLFRPSFRQAAGCAWARKRLEEYGEMESQEFVGIGKSKSGLLVRVFKIRYSRGGVKPMSFFLEENPAASADPAEQSYCFSTFSFIDATSRIKKKAEEVR